VNGAVGGARNKIKGARVLPHGGLWVPLNGPHALFVSAEGADGFAVRHRPQLAQPCQHIAQVSEAGHKQDRTARRRASPLLARRNQIRNGTTPDTACCCRLHACRGEVGGFGGRGVWEGGTSPLQEAVTSILESGEKRQKLMGRLSPTWLP